MAHFAVMYATTGQGDVTRTVILEVVQQFPGLSMQEIAAQGRLSYEQVRRQAPQLTSQGLIYPKREGRKKFYYAGTAIV
ncbi:MAG: helix-turn-helix transcriptional regulator [Elainellaceae cyanobacterium]